MFDTPSATPWYSLLHRRFPPHMPIYGNIPLQPPQDVLWRWVDSVRSSSSSSDGSIEVMLIDHWSEVNFNRQLHSNPYLYIWLVMGERRETHGFTCLFYKPNLRWVGNFYSRNIHLWLLLKIFDLILNLNGYLHFL